MKRGDANFKAGKYADAVLEYRKALQKDGKLGEAYYGLGLAYTEQKDYPNAYLALSRADQFLPHRIDIKVKLADLVLGAYQGDQGNSSLYSVLARLANEIISLDPNSYDGLRMKGNLALFDRKPEQAVEAFKRANEIKPLQEYVVMGYAQALIQTGQGKQAEQIARQLIQRKKDFGPIYGVLFQYYLSTGNKSAAEEVLRERIRNSPGDSNGFIQLASYYRQENKPDAMQSVLDELVQGYAVRPDAFTAAGAFYTSSGDLDKAAAAYEKGSQAEPGQAGELEKLLARVRVGQKRPDEALRILDQVLAKTPNDRDAAFLKANLLSERARPGDLDKAIATYQTILKNQPGDEAAQLGIGSAYYAKSDLEDARKNLVVAKQHPAVAQEARMLLANISLREGKNADALANLDDFLRDSPKDPRARYLRVNALMVSGRYDEARLELDKLSLDFPQSTELNKLRGMLAIASGRYPDAEKIFSGLLTAGGPDFFASTGLADAYIGRQQFDKALQVLEAESRKSPRQTAIRKVIAETELQAGQTDRAIGELQVLLQKEPDSVALLNDLGRAYQMKGDLPKAEQELQRAVQLKSKDPRSYMLLGFTLSASGKPSEAIQAYRQALALQPDNPLVLNNLAYKLAGSNSPRDLDEAVLLAQRALKAVPNEPDFRDTLGWILLKQGKHDQAVQIFSGLAHDAPKNPSYQHHLGLALLAKGSRDDAEKALRAALADNPSPEEQNAITDELKLTSSRI